MTVDTKHLRSKGVIFKISGGDRVLTGTVVNEEEHGLWIVGSDAVAHLWANSGGQIPQQPALFVPFASLAWLIAPNS